MEADRIRELILAGKSVPYQIVCSDGRTTSGLMAYYDRKDGTYELYAGVLSYSSETASWNTDVSPQYINPEVGLFHLSEMETTVQEHSNWIMDFEESRERQIYDAIENGCQALDKKMVKSVNGIAPDENGNVDVQGIYCIDIATEWRWTNSFTIADFDWQEVIGKIESGQIIVARKIEGSLPMLYLNLVSTGRYDEDSPISELYFSAVSAGTEYRLFVYSDGTACVELKEIQQIDGTLKKSGYAADAKVVGDKLGDVESALDHILGIQDELIKGTSETLITFYISGAEHTAVSGMTWAEWCDSKYNTEGYFCDDSAVCTTGGTLAINMSPVIATDVIIDGGEYEWE